MRIFVTGGAGFIGSALIRHLVGQTDCHVLNLDKLTYAGSLTTLDEVSTDPRYRFVEGDVCDSGLLQRIYAEFRPDIVTHLAAETHVDRSIDAPDAFIQSNIVGTYRMLVAAREYWEDLEEPVRSRFRFHHISTDEVFGSLGAEGRFSEETPYDPRSPYSASKAGSDHLVSAWGHTYGLPVLITNCSNNYGPYQFPEKLIPLMIVRAIVGKTLPVYGAGDQVRDWLHVEDHVEALVAVFREGKPGRSYNIGSNSERQNLEVVTSLCRILDELRPLAGGKSYSAQISHVQDRPGHDRRYAIDASRIGRELRWQAAETFESGLRRTVEWYLDNEDWWRPFLNRMADERLGLRKKQ